ncbi:Hypothetical protein in type I retrotransposable element R1DM, partial [Stegodyphus mimosarum]
MDNLNDHDLRSEFTEDCQNKSEECLDDLKGLLNQEDLSKSFKKNIKKCFHRLLDIITIQNLKIANMQGQLEQTQNVEDYLQGLVETKETYAAKAAKNRSRSKSGSKRPNEEHILLVYPKDKEVTSEEVKTNLVTNINPDTLQIGVKSLTKIRRGGVLIEMNKREEIQILEEAIKENQKLKKIMEPKRPIKLNPRVIIYNVDKDISGEGLKDYLIKRNIELENADIEVKFSMNAKYGTNWVISIDPNSYQKLMKTKKVNIQWSRKNIREYLKITQCINCLKFGHTKRTCNMEKCCSKCLNQGHIHSECKEKENKCVNCSHANEIHKLNLDTKHNSFDKGCACKERELENLKRRIDYGLN